MSAFAVPLAGNVLSSCSLGSQPLALQLGSQSLPEEPFPDCVLKAASKELLQSLTLFPLLPFCPNVLAPGAVEAPGVRPINPCR